MKSCIYPGSFDPVTIGHKDIINRISSLFDNVYVSILNNSKKKYMFSTEIRIKMLMQVCAFLPNVKVIYHDGMLIDLLHKLNTNNIIRGIRGNNDLQYEMDMAAVNSNLCATAETIVLFSPPEMQYISSSVVRELITYNANISKFVPAEIIDIIYGGKTS